MQYSLIIFFLNPDKIRSLDDLSDDIKLPGQNTYILMTQEKSKEIEFNSNFENKDDIASCICILINHDLVLQLNHNIFTHLNSIIKEETRLYIVYHNKKNYQNSHKDPMEQEFNDKIKGFVVDNENNESVYGKYLVPLLKEFSKDKFNKLLNYFHNPLFEKIWKTLSLIKVKIKRDVISKKQYAYEINTIKRELRGEDSELESVADALEDFKKIEDHYECMKVFWEKYQEYIDIPTFD